MRSAVLQHFSFIETFLFHGASELKGFTNKNVVNELCDCEKEQIARKAIAKNIWSIKKNHFVVVMKSFEH